MLMQREIGMERMIAAMDRPETLSYAPVPATRRLTRVWRRVVIGIFLLSAFVAAGVMTLRVMRQVSVVRKQQLQVSQSPPAGVLVFSDNDAEQGKAYQPASGSGADELNPPGGALVFAGVLSDKQLERMVVVAIVRDKHGNQDVIQLRGETMVPATMKPGGTPSYEGEKYLVLRIAPDRPAGAVRVMGGRRDPKDASHVEVDYAFGATADGAEKPGVIDVWLTPRGLLLEPRDGPLRRR